MDSEHRLIKERKNKLNELVSWGVNPYPYSFDKTHYASDILEKNKGLENGTSTKQKVAIAGRIVSLRQMGKASFFELQDKSGKIQVYIRRDDVPDQYKIFKKCDMGDFVGIKGHVFATNTGEISVHTDEFEFLVKGLRPLPEKFHGLKDIELRYRKRYVDFVVNPKAKAVFVKRAKILKFIREFLDDKGFIEVQTPILQPLYGGGHARPFITKINAWDMTMYLRIAYEIYLKKLMVGGFEKIYDLSSCFRNEGSDKTHNPEFAMMELQWAYADYNDNMKLTEDMWEYVAKKLNGTTKLDFAGKEIDVKAPWPRIRMVDAVKKFAKIDAEKLSVDELKNVLKKHNIEYVGKFSKGLAISMLFEELCEDSLIQPIHITDHPVEICPLAKPCRNDKRYAERCESFINTWEVGNLYSEINDPVLQRKMFEDQLEHEKAGNDEAHPMDEDFLEAMEYGMPPNSGNGIGVDRMIMLLTGQESIRDIILFPTMKPVGGSKPVKKVTISDDLTGLPSRDDALTLLKKHVKDTYQLLHAKMVATVLEAMADKYKGNKDLWYITGLLHDLDFYENPEDHPLVSLKLFEDKKYPAQLVHAVAAHYFKKTKIMPATDLAKALLSVDEIVGLMYAYSKMRPTGWEGMKVKGFKKKFKDKTFAAAIDRDDIDYGIKALGVDFGEHVNYVVSILIEMEELK
jgi:lysyl-tRNA synthetase, class II